ncbi:MAG: DNA recombination protein RmuC [Spirochaetia bacterium]|nr:DNA recombination protein RmuC [Spirochaetia bacterium]
MIEIWHIVSFAAGLLIGVLVMAIISRKEKRSEEEKQKYFENLFGNLSKQALTENQKSFFEVAKNEFDNLVKKSESKFEEKSKILDTSLQEMNSKISNLTAKTSELKGQMEESNLGILKLSDTTSNLRQILSSSQQRGFWGERMVEDILNFIGLTEGINYDKQSVTDSGRPDYTFHLPRDKHVNMDVKFPLAHYENFLATESELDKEKEKILFLKDVRDHIKHIEKRDYINPAEGTLDYVLMFIPNESIYYFINQEDTKIIDYALSKKIILCSPVTLYAVLSLIRQAVSNFSMEEKAGLMQKLVQNFREQWAKYVDKMEKLGNSLKTTQNHYEELVSARSKQLEKPMEKITELQLGQVTGKKD